MYFHNIPGIPSSLPILKPGDPIPEPGPWSKHIERLPWSIAKEGDLVKSMFVKFMMGQDKKREPVARPTMGLQPERWNEDLRSSIQNVEAVFIQMVGHEASVRCDHCLAGRRIFALCVVVDEPGIPKCCGNFMYGRKGAKCTILQHGQIQPVSVPNAGVYGGVPATGLQTSSASSVRLRADITACLDSVLVQLQQLSTLQQRQAIAVVELESAAESASSALQAVQSRIGKSLPVRYTDVVGVRNFIQAAARTKGSALAISKDS
ncbi:hypothetical protein PENFLA_c002G03095 [Penicillium flavigenum]|uniref:Uncharacterized protein n=1 Tax=Penicillium flavigenum TaxID=254877 RepID=A0A1V6TWK8_9EURO|nr:hypothetical protein PENFLA_c002G03095 [Penicillium flavigenum]